MPPQAKDLMHYMRASRTIFSLFFPKSWRYRMQYDTVNRVLQHYPKLLEHSELNLQLWKKLSSNNVDRDSLVRVTKQDVLTAADKVATSLGVKPCVINMASSIFPSGAALPNGFGSAQEEDLFMRTSLCNDINRELLKQEDGYLYYDPKTKEFIYRDAMANLVSAKQFFSNHERKKLDAMGIVGAQYKVYFNSQPHVCFRAGSIRIRQTISADVPISISGFYTDPGLSFEMLPKESMFPFHELRTAALDLNTLQSEAKVNWSCSKFCDNYRDEMRRRIRAQLHTLILHQQKYVILSAFGCGAYLGQAEIVAEIFREELETLGCFFEQVEFAILDNHGEGNFQTFYRSLDGLQLGNYTRRSDSIMKA